MSTDVKALASNTEAGAERKAPELVKVVIPSHDIYDYSFEPIWINADSYGPGEHFVSPERAAALLDAMRRKELSDMRLLRPKADKKTLQEVYKTSGYSPDNFAK